MDDEVLRRGDSSPRNDASRGRESRRSARLPARDRAFLRPRSDEICRLRTSLIGRSLPDAAYDDRVTAPRASGAGDAFERPGVGL